MNDMAEVTNGAIQELENYRISGLLKTITDSESKALILEKDVGLDRFYTLMTMGQSVEQMADSIGVSENMMTFFLTRTESHRKNFFNAKMYKAAVNSVDKINDYKDDVNLNEAKHHRDIVGMAANILNKSEEGAERAIVVHNNITVGTNKDVPALPDELEDILEGDFEEL